MAREGDQAALESIFIQYRDRLIRRRCGSAAILKMPRMPCKTVVFSLSKSAPLPRSVAVFDLAHSHSNQCALASARNDPPVLV
jgi:hypothetical protein